MAFNQLKPIYLASASPRRAELLRQMNVEFELLSVDVDEMLREDETAEQYVSRLALDKAIEGHKAAKNKEIPVLGSDTAICINNKILGKPVDFHDAQRMLRLLSNNKHQVLTAVALAGANKHLSIIQSSNVYLRKISDAEIKAYWETGEPKDKAGAYAIQGLAAMFISRIEGSYSGVMGLPIHETADLLENYYQ